jgi:hypothetical protein
MGSSRPQQRLPSSQGPNGSRGAARRKNNNTVIANQNGHETSHQAYEGEASQQ